MAVEKKKRGAGPSKYTKDLPDKVLEWKKQGVSDNEIATLIGVSIRTLQRWSKDPRKQSFIKAWDLGRQAEEGFWEKLGRDGIQGNVPKFNAATFIYMMKCKFKGKWLEDHSVSKHEHTYKYEGMTDTELNDVIKAKLKANKKIIDIDEYRKAN